MKLLSSEVKNLLDKLYNLRSEDSVILKRMNKEREEAIATQERTKNEKEALLQKIDKLTKDESELAEQGNYLIDVLSNINRDDFAAVLDRLNIDFEPDKIHEKVRQTLPETIEKVVEENKKASEELEKVETEMNNSITLVEELGIRKDEALSNQAKLNEYIELALNGNINITRDALTSLLEKFDFNENEQREAAKILMFPEDALYEYDASVKSGEKTSGKSMAEVFAEAKKESEVEVTPIQEIEQTLEETAITDLAEVEDVTELIVEQPKEEVTKETLIAKLQSLGISEGIFTPNELAMLIENYDESLLEDSVKALKSHNIDLNILKNNATLLYDRELDEKITKLLEIGKMPGDIYLVPNVLKKYDLNGLTNTINVLQTSGLDPKKVPLMAF